MSENQENIEELKVPGGENQLDLNLGEGEQGAEIEISDDGKAEIKSLSNDENDENSSKSSENSQKRTPEEHEEYSGKVKKRIEKMTAKLREAERREQAALEYARQIQGNLQAVQQRAQILDQGYMHETKGRIDSQLAIAEANLQDAVERGDGKAAVEAQKLLSSLIVQQERLSQRVVQAPQPIAPQQVYPQQVYQSAPPPRPDQKAEKWAEENEWFGSDKVMTHAAFGIHSQLEDEGFDLSSDEYYDELNRRLRKEFPQKFRKPQVNANVDAPGIAPATRGTSVSPTGRRTIKLTPSEVAIARKLGVPLEEYAKYVRR